jgi:hypothetical protein
MWRCLPCNETMNDDIVVRRLVATSLSATWQLDLAGARSGAAVGGGCRGGHGVPWPCGCCS